MIASSTVKRDPFGYTHEPSLEPEGNRIRVKSHVFRVVALNALKSVILLLRIAKRRADYAQGKTVTDEELLPYTTPESEPRAIAFLHAVINETFESADAHAALHAKLVLRHLSAADNVSAMVSSLDAANRMHTEALAALGAASYAAFTPATCPGCISTRTTQAGPSYSQGESSQQAEEELLPAPFFTFAVGDEPDELTVSWTDDLGDSFLAANAAVAQKLRAENKNPSFVDFVATHLAYHILEQGPTLVPIQMCPLETPGFRHNRTALVLSDPGDGHLFQTTRNVDWMTDTIIHVQHPDNAEARLSHTPLQDFARTRLHTADAAPAVFFAGPALGNVHASEFKMSKALNSATIIANHAFQLGAAECQFSVDRLPTSQLTACMQFLSAHARRNHKQCLSVFVDLSQPLADDLAPDAHGRATVLSDPIAVALRATGLAARSGFTKIAFGGDERGVVGQLGFKDALAVVHAAHSMGLSTQISAQFSPAGVRDAVYTGADAISGLRGMTHPSTHDAFVDAVVARGEADDSVRGRAAFLLARLDTMHHEGSITYCQARFRVQLARVLASGNDIAAHRLISEHWAIARELQLLAPAPRSAPCVARAQRLLLSKEETALRRGAYALPKGVEQWEEFTSTLRRLVEEEDEAAIFQYSRSEPWKSFHKSHTGFAQEADSYFEMPACLNPKAVHRATRATVF